MSRVSKPNVPRAPTTSVIEVKTGNNVALVSVSGLIDEKFLGFGNVGAARSVVLNVAGISRMTSFGVRQWIKGLEGLPKTISDLYLMGCPTFLVDQLNMVLNFGGASKILTVIAPYTCPACGVESGETIDLVAERAILTKGQAPEKTCGKCGAKLELDEVAESYFGFVGKYGATSIQPEAAELLATLGLYSSQDQGAGKPPRIIKLVHGSVTYFRIIGTIGSMFRARPFLVGAEGEVVIDLAEVDRFDPAGKTEWKRLLKSMSTQVPAITLVDLPRSFLAAASDTLTAAKNIAVASVLFPYRCVECERSSLNSGSLEDASWPLELDSHVCSTCGGETRSELPPELLAPLEKAKRQVPSASMKVIAQREEILSRALTDANVAQAGDAASASVIADDTILGKYKIVRRLSEGGMAEVFLAKQVGIGGFEKPVALKRIQRKLLESRQQAIELFLNEAKIAGRLTHPNIVQVLDVGEVGGALYLAMEYVHGKDLRGVIRKLQSDRTVMPIAEACYVVREVAQALDHAYWSTDMAGKQNSVVHRDVSPHNIILSYEGTVKLLDFGVAMSAVTEHAESIIVGKWLYMSPESTTNQQIDHRSDLFSLGVIFYLLCSGLMPFTGKEPKDIVKKLREGRFKPLEEVSPEVPPELAALVNRLLSPAPKDRPQRGQEVVTELTRIAREHRLQSSGARVAALLRHLFPEDAKAELELNRASGGGAGATDEFSHTMKDDRSPVSVTPSASIGRLAPIDISQTFQQPKADVVAVIEASEPPEDAAAEKTSPARPQAPAKSYGAIWFVLAVLVGIAVATYLLLST